MRRLDFFGMVALAGTLALSNRAPLGQSPLERSADHGGPIKESQDTPASPVERLTRQQRRWRERHPGRL